MLAIYLSQTSIRVLPAVAKVQTNISATIRCRYGVIARTWCSLTPDSGVRLARDLVNTLWSGAGYVVDIEVRLCFLLGGMGRVCSASNLPDVVL
jgi:hypothetical protein